MEVSKLSTNYKTPSIYVKENKKKKDNQNIRQERINPAQCISCGGRFAYTLICE